MSNKREQIVEAASRLIEMQGYHATGLNQILAESGSPKGSLYYYFPDGKDGLIEEAIAATGRKIVGHLEEGMAAYASPAEAIPTFLRNMSYYVEASGFSTGGPVTAVALEAASTNERLNKACRTVYRSWQAVIEKKLLECDYEPDRAARLATVVISVIEGAIILSRNERNVKPILDAAAELETLLLCG